jgi:site-specific DNA-cytosine methylase
MFTDIIQRAFGRDSISSVDEHGKRVTITRAFALLDLYVAGFPCTPFSPLGERHGWQDEAAKVFYACMKTISALRPRAVVLENVPAILVRKNIGQLQRILKAISGYHTRVIKANSSSHGLPQHRERVYIFMWRVEELVVEEPGELDEIVAKALKSTRRPCRAPWPEWLQAIGLPIEPALSVESLESWARARPCGYCPPNRCSPPHV